MNAASANHPNLSLEEAIEVFVKGFTFTRSLTHLYLGERIGSLWVMRDAPRKNNRYRSEEWVARQAQPAEVCSTIQKHSRGRYRLCGVIPANESDAALRSGYKDLGYRLHGSEPFMVHSLKRIPRRDSPAKIEKVTTHKMAEAFGQATRSRRVLKEHLTPDSPIRRYAALIDDEIVGWVTSVTADGATWCADMYVKAPFRRRGIGSALLCRMLRDDRSHGAIAAVLLASHTGAKLYATVGYEQIGTLFIFHPCHR